MLSPQEWWDFILYEPLRSETLTKQPRPKSADANQKKAPARRIRRVPSQERGKRSRDQILEGALKLIAAQGISGFNMREVAKVSGVGLGTLYEYFPSRSSILCLLLEDRIKQRLEILRRYGIDNNPGRTPLELLAAFDAEMRSKRMWTRADVMLFSKEIDDPEVVELRNGFHQQLQETYVRAFRTYGSKWSDTGLHALARYLIHADFLNIELQLKIDPKQRHYYADFTYAIFERAFSLVLEDEGVFTNRYGRPTATTQID